MILHMTTMEWLEALSYLVTIIALPFGIWVFMKEQQKERLNDDEELYLQLSDDYSKFLRLVLENADLRLMTQSEPAAPFNPEQVERRDILFEILISIFERAYILVYEEKMSRQTARLWQTWEDYMRYWCRRRDFRSILPSLLEGEDPDFQRHINAIAGKEALTPKNPSASA
ncbi:MAG TPA: hypothetical protein VIM44_00305 [Rariglobus sp.]